MAPLLEQHPQPEWTLIAVYLVELRWRRQQQQQQQQGGLADKWGPYIDVLPQQPGSVLEWSEKVSG